MESAVNESRHPRTHRWWQRICRQGVLASATLAAFSGSGALLRAEPNSLRSVNDARPRIPDELDRPVRRETSSHRSWEIREDQFTIVANTSLEDAQWAAAAVTKARGQMASLADRFTSVHRHPDFGLNSLQVVIDGEPPRERDAPLVTINVAGIQTQAVINVSHGRPALKEQLLRLREAASFATLHAAQLDAVLPPWVIGGLAAHIAREDQPADAPQPNDFAPRGEPLAGGQWRSKRAMQDRLDLTPLDRSDAASRIGFLLAGDDGQHAPVLLDALAEAMQSGRSSAASQSVTRRRGEEQQVVQESRLTDLLAANHSQFEAWQKDPQTGQPIVEGELSNDAEVATAQRDMLIVLKLQRRLSAERTLGHAVKVATFDREKGRQALKPAEERQPMPIAEVAGRLRDPAKGAVATIDADGSLLLSTDRRRIDRLLGWDGQRFALERREDQWVLATRLADGRVLRGYLNDNPDKPGRPLAKFSLDDPAARGAKPKPAAKANDAAANAN